MGDPRGESPQEPGQPRLVPNLGRREPQCCRHTQPEDRHGFGVSLHSTGVRWGPSRENIRGTVIRHGPHRPRPCGEGARLHPFLSSVHSLGKRFLSSSHPALGPQDKEIRMSPS